MEVAFCVALAGSLSDSPLKAVPGVCSREAPVGLRSEQNSSAPDSQEATLAQAFSLGCSPLSEIPPPFLALTYEHHQIVGWGENKATVLSFLKMITLH